jgi:hypothetical protein
MPIPLSEIEAILQREHKLRRYLGSRVLRNCCMQCQLTQCNPASSGCQARLLRNARVSASYRRHRTRKGAERRARYHANREREIARVMRYQSDPTVKALRKLKRGASKSVRA